ncbi:13156_t:CDS:2, partial [Gigaspora rosea]
RGDVEKLKLVKNWSEKAAKPIKETPLYQDLIKRSENVISGLYKITKVIVSFISSVSRYTIWEIISKK